MQASKIRVFHIVKWYPNPEDDLAGIFIPRQIASLDENIENHVFYARKYKNEKKIIKKDSDFGLFKEYHSYYPDRYTGIGLIDRILKIYFYFKTINKLISECKRNSGKPHLIHAHVMTRTVAMSYFLKLKWNVPIVLTEHWSVYQKTNWLKRNMIWKNLTRFFLNKIDVALPVSENLGNAMKSLGLKREVKVIYNVVDTDKFKLREDSKKDAFRFIHVSDFTEFTKNVKGILNAFKSLIKKNKEVELVLVGYGAYENEIKNHAVKLGLSDGYVNFKGKLLDEKLVQELRQADAFVLFSKYENLPCVLSEAMSCGIPVISSDVGGISEIINKENGILVESQNENELVNAMHYMIKNKDLYDPQKIRQFALDHFSNKTIGRKIKNVYLDLIK